MSFSALLRTSISTMKREPLIVVPYMAFYFCSQILETRYASSFQDAKDITFQMVQLFLLRWGLELFVSVLTVSFVLFLLVKKDLDIQDAFQKAFYRFPSLLISSVLVVCPLVAILFTTGFSFEKMGLLQGGLLVAFLLPISIVLQFLPVTVMLQNGSGISVLKLTIKTLAGHVKSVLKFSMLIFLLTILTLIFGEVFMQVPVLGRAVLSGIIFGVFSTCVTVLTFHFYKDISKQL